jgi:hypothetical protein
MITNKYNKTVSTILLILSMVVAGLFSQTMEIKVSSEYCEDCEENVFIKAKVYPYAFAVALDSNIYFGDPVKKNIKKHFKSGRFLEVLACTSKGESFVPGEIYASDNGGIVVLNEKGTLMATYSGSGSLAVQVFESSGKALLAERNAALMDAKALTVDYYLETVEGMSKKMKNRLKALKGNRTFGGVSPDKSSFYITKSGAYTLSITEYNLKGNKLESFAFNISDINCELVLAGKKHRSTLKIYNGYRFALGACSDGLFILSDAP